MYEKGKTKEFEDELIKALRQIILSKEAQEGFYCPFGKVSHSAMAELGRNLEEKREEIKRLQSEIDEWKHKTTQINQTQEEIDCELKAQKKDNLRLVEDLKKLESELGSEKETCEKLREEVRDQLSSLDDLMNAKEKNLNKTLVDLAKQIEQSIKTSTQNEETNRLLVFNLSKDILSKIYHIYEEYGKEYDKRVNEIRDRHNGIVMKVGNNLMLDGRIPMKFLNLANVLLRKAEQASKDQKRDLAMGYREAVEELLTTVERLLEDPETSKQLQILKGHV
jgi:chromosome segregation ATPase